MSMGLKRSFNDTMDNSTTSRLSLFPSMSSFKRQRTSEAPLLPSRTSGGSAAPLASRIMSALSGNLQPNMTLNPQKSEIDSRRSTITSFGGGNGSRSPQNSSLAGNSTAFGSLLRQSLGNVSFNSSGLKQNSGNFSELSPSSSFSLAKHGFTIVGTHTLGIGAHRQRQTSPDVVRLKMALLQNYRDRIARKEQLLTEKFDAESSRLIAERTQQLHAQQEAQEKELDEKLAFKPSRSALQLQQGEQNQGEEGYPLPLTAEQRNLVAQQFAAAQRSPRDVVVDAFKVELTYADLATLKPGKWLNDNVIDMYMSVLAARNPKIFVFTTHFFTRLEEGGYSAVRRWALRKKLDVFVPDQVFIPVNRGNLHWTLAVVDNKRKQLAFYDSLPSGRGKRELQLILGYLHEEAKRLGRSTIPDYEIIADAPGPTQSNGSDCGVFVCEAVTRLAQGLPLNHSQRNMPQVRERIAFNLLEQRQSSRM